MGKEEEEEQEGAHGREQGGEDEAWTSSVLNNQQHSESIREDLKKNNTVGTCSRTSQQSSDPVLEDEMGRNRRASGTHFTSPAAGTLKQQCAGIQTHKFNVDSDVMSE